MRIALVRLSALGDIVHTWPLADAIRSRVPGAHLTWVVEEPMAPLVEGHPAVDCVLTTATRRWRRRPFASVTRAEIDRLKSRLHELQIDVTIDPQGTFKSATVTRWSSARRRVGLARPWRREWIAGFAYTETIRARAVSTHVVATNLELVRAVGGTPPAKPTPPDGRWLLRRSTPSDHTDDRRRRRGVILPGAGRTDKILPTTTLADTARHLAASGLDAVVAWGPAERDRALEVVKAGGDGVRLAPPTNLPELCSLLASATIVVGGDTGPVHLAASLGVPTLAVFLTTDAARNRPLGDQTEVVSGAARASAPTGSATTHAERPVAAPEICAAADSLLARGSP
jgi:lipopolysaccharide heptosyltransferase I